VVDGASFCVDVEGVDAMSSFVGVSLEFRRSSVRVSPDFTRSLDMALDIAFEIISVRFNAVGCRQGQLIDIACINLYRLHQVHFT
jgi:hypothetical protein